MEYRDSADISGASVNRAGGSRGSAGGRIALGGGSSAQRKNWTSIGFKTGDWTKCDTFGATNLG